MSSIEFSSRIEIPEITEQTEITAALEATKNEETELANELILGKEKYDWLSDYSWRLTEIQEWTLSSLVGKELSLHDPETNVNIEGLSFEEEGKGNWLAINTKYMYNGAELSFGTENDDGSINPRTNGTNMEWGDRGIANQKINWYRLAKIPTGEGVEINPKENLQTILGEELYTELKKSDYKVKDTMQFIGQKRASSPNKTLVEICSAYPNDKIIQLIGKLWPISSPSSFANFSQNVEYLDEAENTQTKIYERINYGLILLKDNEILDENGKICEKVTETATSTSEYKVLQENLTPEEEQTIFDRNISVIEKKLEAWVWYSEVKDMINAIEQTLTTNTSLQADVKNELIQKILKIKTTYEEEAPIDVESISTTSAIEFQDTEIFTGEEIDILKWKLEDQYVIDNFENIMQQKMNSMNEDYEWNLSDTEQVNRVKKVLELSIAIEDKTCQELEHLRITNLEGNEVQLNKNELEQAKKDYIDGKDVVALTINWEEIKFSIRFMNVTDNQAISWSRNLNVVDRHIATYYTSWSIDVSMIKADPIEIKNDRIAKKTIEKVTTADWRPIFENEKNISLEEIFTTEELNTIKTNCTNTYVLENFDNIIWNQMNSVNQSYERDLNNPEQIARVKKVLEISIILQDKTCAAIDNMQVLDLNWNGVFLNEAEKAQAKKDYIDWKSTISFTINNETVKFYINFMEITDAQALSWETDMSTLDFWINSHYKNWIIDPTTINANKISSKNENYVIK
jgi:hypothetical protein